MFGNCSNLTSLGGMENWNLSAVTTFQGFVLGCKGLQKYSIKYKCTTNFYKLYV